MPAGRLSIAGPDILKVLDSAPQNVFSHKELAQILATNRDDWRLAMRTTVAQFLDFLERRGLKTIQLEFIHPGIRSITRYIWKAASPFEDRAVAQGTGVPVPWNRGFFKCPYGPVAENRLRQSGAVRKE